MTHKKVALSGIIFVVAGLILVLLIGGCALTGCFSEGPSDNGTPTPTTEPPTITTSPPTTAPNGTNDTNNSEFRNVKLPDGAYEDGLNASILSRLHSEYMGGNSNTFEYMFVINRENGAEMTTIESVEEDNGTVFISSDLPNGEREVWANSSVVARATDTGLNTYFSVSESDISSVDTQRVNLENILNSGNYEARRVIERNNNTFIVYDGINASENAENILPGESVSDYSSTVIVSLDGYIKGFSISYNTTYYGSSAEIDMEGIYSSIGNTSPSKPGWVSPAISEQTQLEKNNNDQYSSLFHLGGREIPEGTVLEINHEGNKYTTEIESTLERGDVIYLYKQNGTIKVSQNEPTGTTGLDSGTHIVTGYKNGAEVIKFKLIVGE